MLASAFQDGCVAKSLDERALAGFFVSTEIDEQGRMVVFDQRCQGIRCQHSFKDGFRFVPAAQVRQDLGLE